MQKFQLSKFGWLTLVPQQHGSDFSYQDISTGCNCKVIIQFMHTQSVCCFPVCQWQTHTTFYKNGSLEERPGQERWRCTKKRISDIRGSKIQISCKGITEGRADRRNADTVNIWKTRCAGRRNEWRQTYQHKGRKWLWLKGWRCPRRNDACWKKIFTLKEFLEIFHNSEITRDKMLEADPNVGRSMTSQSRLVDLF